MSGVSSGRVQVAIVGAGIAGLGLGIRLRQQGRRDFVILEAAQSVGGVWRDNVYPGVACDIPGELYSYSFRPHTGWSRLFPPGAEILGYLAEAAREEGLLGHLRLATPMLAARWREDAGCWRIETGGGLLDAEVLVLAAGRQTVPLMPDVPGLDVFKGRAFHSSRWDPVPLEECRVGVVGSGASAIQLLPHVAARAASTVLFQRTPAWVLPRGDRPLLAEEPTDGRDELSTEADTLYRARLHGSEAAARLAERARAHLRTQVADPELRRLLTPDYEIGCKRAVFSDDYYPALSSDRVTLEPSALSRVEGNTAVAASGRAFDLDVLVLATGFDTARPSYAAAVTGRHGTTLAEHWVDGMRTYASTSVSGFPNLFVMGGPNAALGHHSAFEVLEPQMAYVLGALDHLDRAPRPLDVRPEAEASYLRLIDTLAEGTVWTQGGCTSWYLDRGTGRPGLLWPAPAAEFRRRFGSFDPAPYV